VEIASANSRAERGPKTPPEEEILKQAMIASFRQHSPDRAAPVDAGVLAPAFSARGSAPLVAAAELACRPSPHPASGSSAAPQQPFRAFAHPHEHLALGPQPSAPMSARYGAASPRPLWMDVAHRLPAGSRAAIGGPPVSANGGVSEDSDLARVRRVHEQQVAELQQQLGSERKHVQELIRRNTRLRDEALSERRSSVAEATEAQEIRDRFARRDREAMQYEQHARQCRDEMDAEGRKAAALHAELRQAELQVERQHLAADAACRELRWEAHCHAEAQQTSELSAEQERADKVRAIQEARTYQALLQGLEQERQRLVIEGLRQEELLTALGVTMSKAMSSTAPAGGLSAVSTATALELWQEQVSELAALRGVVEQRDLEVCEFRAQNEEFVAAARSVGVQDGLEWEEDVSNRTTRAKPVGAKLELPESATPATCRGGAGSFGLDANDAKAKAGGAGVEDCVGLHTPHFSRSPTESPTFQRADPALPHSASCDTVTAQLAAVLRESEAMSSVLRSEVAELQEQNRKLRRRLAVDPIGAGGSATGDFIAWWKGWQDEALEPLRQRCEAERHARQVADYEVERLRGEAKDLLRDAARQAAVMATLEKEVAAARVSMEQFLEAAPLPAPKA